MFCLYLLALLLSLPVCTPAQDLSDGMEDMAMDADENAPGDSMDIEPGDNNYGGQDQAGDSGEDDGQDDEDSAPFETAAQMLGSDAGSAFQQDINEGDKAFFAQETSFDNDNSDL